MYYGSLGSYVSLLLLIKTTHLKQEEFNFLLIIFKKPKSDFCHSLLMTEKKCFPQNIKALYPRKHYARRFLKESFTDLEIRDSPFLK